TSVLVCFEEGLRHGGLGAVVAEVARLSMTASRRLQLAAESSGAIGIAIRRWRWPTEAADFGQPTASVTRWRVSALPATPLPVPGVGRARWQLELIRCRAGESADFEVEACDAKGRLALPSNLVHGPGEKDIGRRRAAR
ncbi:MAG: ImuA family protein, partial [Steroidobacteraceae bacterium]